MYRAELVDRSTCPGGRWTVSVDGQPPLVWDGFTTGPVVLSDDELDDLSRTLLDVPMAEVAAVAAVEVESFVAGDGPPPPAMLLHSATSSTRGFEGDLADVRAGRRPWDVAGYLETRVVALARPGDLAVGRTVPWKDAVTARGVDHLDVGDLDHYYLAQALLVAARDWDGTTAGPVGTAVDWLRRHPTAVVRIYALDRELQILLTWMRRAAGLDVVRIDANNPVVSGRWNQKNHIHPTVEVASTLGVPVPASAPPFGLLAAEQRAGEAHRRLAMTIPVLPGYTIVRTGRSESAFVATTLHAAALLRSRHGIRRGCLKPSEAGDGARIVPGLDLDNAPLLESEARSAYSHGDDYLLEAHVEFLQFSQGDRAFVLSPSGHVRNGHVAPGLTVQLMNGQAWEGNAYIDEATCSGVGLNPDTYAELRAALVEIRDAFYTPMAKAEDCYAGLVTGGIDFAVGRVGGRYGDEVLAAAIDFNLSSHGAEYLRAFLDEVHPLGHRYAATRVYRPSARAVLAETDAAVRANAPAGEIVSTVASVPGSWGMVASTGPDPLAAISHVLGLVERLAALGLTSD